MFGFWAKPVIARAEMHAVVKDFKCIFMSVADLPIVENLFVQSVKHEEIRIRDILPVARIFPVIHHR